MFRFPPIGTSKVALRSTIFTSSTDCPEHIGDLTAVEIWAANTTDALPLATSSAVDVRGGGKILTGWVPHAATTHGAVINNRVAKQGARFRVE